MNHSSEDILNAFRQIWINRSLESNEDAHTTLLNAIQVDLQDELSHPRVRVSPYQKFHLAVRRIIQSKLTDQDKLVLIRIYEEEITKLTATK
ncbi:hypothetical protein ACFSCX_11440 [Bacillus salitolerans]|uniref:Uncharacterized protein n=1 Tax=Bacillus salitolerans TaxID=1437434 RepID=A0ABW4LPN7_9BACI